MEAGRDVGVTIRLMHSCGGWNERGMIQLLWWGDEGRCCSTQVKGGGLLLVGSSYLLVYLDQALWFLSLWLSKAELVK